MKCFESDSPISAKIGAKVTSTEGAVHGTFAHRVSTHPISAVGKMHMLTPMNAWGK